MTEDELLERLQGVYADALTQAIKNQKDFLKKVQDVQSGKIKPPQYYVDRDEVDKWKQGFLTELARRDQIVDGIMKDINNAGAIAGQMISGDMPNVFANARDEQIESLIGETSVSFGYEPSFAVYNRKQIEILMKDEKNSPFSKIAYKNLGKNQDIRRRLQHELSVSIINGESQDKMIKRIKGVTESGYKKARTIAQTERNRVQAQGAHEAATEAHAMGIRTYKKWYCANMPTSRDNHIKLHGACALTNELFKYTADGNEVPYPLMYPGDASAPADQVVNCHCTYVEHVLLDDEDVVEGKIVIIQRTPKTLLGYGNVQQNFYDEHYSDYPFSDKLDNVNASLKELAETSNVSMCIRESNLEEAIHTHFKNCVEVQPGSPYTKSRMKLTEDLFCADSKDLKPVDYEKYGILTEKNPLEAYRNIGDAASYGDILVTFKKKDVVDRTTFTIGDSMQKWYDKSDTIPTLLSNPCAVVVDNVPEANSQIMDKSIGVHEAWRRTAGRKYNSYIEAQIHGEIGIQNVESITFPSIPKDSIINDLKDAGITIYYICEGDILHEI